MLINCKAKSVLLPNTNKYTFIMCLDFFVTSFLPYSTNYYKKNKDNQNVLCHMRLAARRYDIYTDITENSFSLTKEYTYVN